MKVDRHNHVIQDLADLGLSPNEATIYLVILKHGEAPAGLVLDDVSMHREQVYRALKRLVDLGLLITFRKHKRAYYSAANPRALVEKAEEKAAKARSLMPYLEGLRLVKPQEIQVYEGEEGLRQSLQEHVSLVGDGGEFVVIGNAEAHFYDLTKDYLAHYQKLYLKHKITARTVTFKEYAYQPARGPSDTGVGTATVVSGDQVCIQILDPDNIAIINILNKRIADSYRYTFEALWQLPDNIVIKRRLNGLMPE